MVQRVDRKKTIKVVPMMEHFQWHVLAERKARKSHFPLIIVYQAFFVGYH